MPWATIFLVAALVLFLAEAWLHKSLIAAGLACLAAALLAGGR